MPFKFSLKSRARRREIEAETARRRADEREGRDGSSEERREEAERAKRERMKNRVASTPPTFGSADWRAHERTMRGE
jgi:hypothetical protein